MITKRDRAVAAAQAARLLAEQAPANTAGPLWHATGRFDTLVEYAGLLSSQTINREIRAFRDQVEAFGPLFTEQLTAVEATK